MCSLSGYIEKEKKKYNQSIMSQSQKIKTIVYIVFLQN